MCASPSASGSIRFSAEQPSRRLRLAKDSGRYSSADLRLTPAFAKSYGVASSRLYPPSPRLRRAEQSRQRRFSDAIRHVGRIFDTSLTSLL
jgi:hypothetical protein